MKRALIFLVALAPSLALAAVPAPVTPVAPTGPVTDGSALVGTTSAQVLASANRKFLLLQNVSPTADISCNFNGAAVLGGQGSIFLPKGSAPLVLGFGGYVPSNALTCIASAAGTPLTVKWN